MADIKISALAAAASVTPDDLLVIVDDPGGAATTKKITVADFVSTSGAIGGSGTLNTIPLFTPNGTTLGNSILTQSSGNVTLTQLVNTSGTPSALTITGAVHTTLTASVPQTDVLLDLSRNVEFATGAMPFVSGLTVRGATYSFVGASLIDTAANTIITGSPIAGANASIGVSATLLVAPLDGYGTDGSAAIATGMPSIANGIGATTILAGIITNPNDAISLGDQIATTGMLATVYIGQVTGNATAARTVTNATSLYVQGPPIAGTNVTFTNLATAATFDGNIKIGNGTDYTIFTSLALGGLLINTSNGAADLYIRCGSQMFIADSSTDLLTIGRIDGAFPVTAQGSWTHTQFAQAGTANPLMTLTGAAHTALTASTESICANFNFSATKTWATGAIGTQREFLIQAPTYAFAAASTITTAATLAITGAPIAGANATISNKLALWTQAGISRFDGGIQMNGVNFASSDGSINKIYSGPSSLNIVDQTGGSTNLIIDNAGNITSTSQIQTAGAPVALTMTPGAHTGLTASTEVKSINFNFSATKTWATGDFFLQREFIVQAPTYAFAAASTITVAATMAITGAPIAGANASLFVSTSLLLESFLGTASNIFSQLTLLPGIANGVGAVESMAAWAIGSLGSISLGDQTSTVSILSGLNLDGGTYVSTTNVRTVTDAVNVYIKSAPTASTNVVFTNPALGLRVDANSYFKGRILGERLNVASANDLTLTDASVFTIMGAVTINAITTLAWIAGSHVTLIFQSTPTVKHNTAGGAGTAKIFLAGSADFVAATDSILGLVYDGSQWQETFRKAA